MSPDSPRTRELLGADIEQAAAGISIDRMMTVAPYDAFRLARAYRHLGVSEMEILQAIVAAIRLRNRASEAPA